MKINVEVDCTPEEARRFMGLPDFSPVHEKYIGNILESMDNGINPEFMENLFKNWAPMGEAGVKMWRQMMENMGGPK
ncbi:DUF6489 family protein [Sphingobium boeckii]|uniref:Uncharacterized protein n=1 Tax=Sphingobium boeckii TaxID=1082345 RepID=A0A7W9AE92_9SPHN|nr:hypothetical protein [Sphingobium boeckii]